MSETTKNPIPDQPISPNHGRPIRVGDTVYHPRLDPIIQAADQRRELEASARGTGPRAATARRRLRELDRQVVVDGVPVSAPTSSPNAFTAAQLEEIAEVDRRDNELRWQVAAINAALVADAKRGSSRRGGALKPDLHGWNKSVIEVLNFSGEPLRGSKGNLVGSFDQFVITQVQEQDAEKINIQETFGAPHLFASGRFMRKYMFAGVARAAAVNYQAQDSAIATPQAVQLRYCYDHHLRASLQAERGHYTRVVVDGDAYEGWITTYNQTRDSQNENWINFVFSLVAYDRYHLGLEGDAASLFRQWGTKPRETGEDEVKQPSAELSDALGKADVRVSKTPDGEMEPTLDLGVVELTAATAGSAPGLSFFYGTVGPEGDEAVTQQTLSVVPSDMGLDVVSEGVTVNATKSPAGGRRASAQLVVTDYRRLVLSQGDKQWAQVSATIAPAAGKPATVTARIKTTDLSEAKMTLISARMLRAGGAPSLVLSGGSSVPLSAPGAPLVLGTPAAWTDTEEGVVLPGNQISLELRIKFEVEGRPAPENLLTALAVEQSPTRVTPQISAVAQASSESDKNKISLVTGPTITRTDYSVEDGTATFVVVASVASPAYDLRAPVNPTVATTAVRFQSLLVFSAPGISPTETRSFIVDMKLKAFALSREDLWAPPVFSVSSSAATQGEVTLSYTAAPAAGDFSTLFGDARWSSIRAAFASPATLQVWVGAESVEPRRGIEWFEFILPLADGQTVSPRSLGSLRRRPVLRISRVHLAETGLSIQVVLGVSSNNSETTDRIRIWVRDVRPRWDAVLGYFGPPPVVDGGKPFLAFGLA